jgi:anti-sigma B factor antagonist
VTQHGDVRVVGDGSHWVMEGEIDAAVQDRLEKRLADLVGRADRPITIDLSTVTFMDSGGLRLLYNAALGSSGPPRLLGASERIRDLLELSGVSGLFEHQATAGGSRAQVDQ